MRVFISYCHQDEEFKDRLKTHLSVTSELEIWDDRKIGAGSDWEGAINNALDEADAAVLLITAGFLASSFITQNEVPALLARRRVEGMPVIPVIGKPCAWQRVDWLAAVQACPRDGKPIMSESPARQEQLFYEAAEMILKALEHRR